MVFAKRGFQRAMPLYFLKFVTNGRFLEIMPLGGFRKEGISKGDAIRFSGVCHRQGLPGNRDIK